MRLEQARALHNSESGLLATVAALIWKQAGCIPNVVFSTQSSGREVVNGTQWF
jgi:hypothetical protein